MAVLHWNTFRFVESVCAVARLGATFIPLLAILTEEDHAYMIADSGSPSSVCFQSSHYA